MHRGPLNQNSGWAMAHPVHPAAPPPPMIVLSSPHIRLRNLFTHTFQYPEKNPGHTNITALIHSGKFKGNGGGGDRPPLAHIFFFKKAAFSA